MIHRELGRRSEGLAGSKDRIPSGRRLVHFTPPHPLRRPDAVPLVHRPDLETPTGFGISLKFCSPNSRPR